MFTEDDYVQLSALQHYVFCPRQFGLIHVDDVWHDNLFTVRGEILHEKVDTDTYETRGTVKTIRGMRIHSTRLGLTGRCDVVELHESSASQQGVFPVEFKSGEPKEDISDKVQLCAQALCLEEMMNVSIPRGAFFYGKIRRRVPLEIDADIRKQTEEIIDAVHAIMKAQRVPSAQYGPQCRNCSLESICLPKAMNEKKLNEYINKLYVPE